MSKPKLKTKNKTAQTPLAIPLEEVLAAHDLHNSNKITNNNLGDGFLCFHNPIYKNIREVFDLLGFSFVNDNFNFYRPIFASPQIKIIVTKALESGKLPIKDNSTVVRELSLETPGQFLLGELPFLARNRPLYDSSHLIAHKVFSQVDLSPDSALEEERIVAIHKNLFMSFASTNELMGTAFCETDMHKCFYTRNSFQPPTPEKIKSLRQMIDFFGFRNTFSLILIGCANENFYLGSSLEIASNDLIYKMINIKKPTGIQKKFITRGLQLGASLRSDFSPVFLRLAGINTNISKILEFNFIQMLLEEKNWFLKFNSLADIAENGSQGKTFEALISLPNSNLAKKAVSF